MLISTHGRRQPLLHRDCAPPAGRRRRHPRARPRPASRRPHWPGSRPRPDSPSSGLISYHFDDKDDVLTTVAEQLVADCAGAVERAVARAPDRPRRCAPTWRRSWGGEDTHRDGVHTLWRLSAGWKAPGSDRAFDGSVLVAPLLRLLVEGVRGGGFAPGRRPAGGRRRRTGGAGVRRGAPRRRRPRRGRVRGRAGRPLRAGSGAARWVVTSGTAAIPERKARAVGALHGRVLEIGAGPRRHLGPVRRRRRLAPAPSPRRAGSAPWPSRRPGTATTGRRCAPTPRTSRCPTRASTPWSPS